MTMTMNNMAKVNNIEVEGVEEKPKGLSQEEVWNERGYESLEKRAD